MKFLKNIGLFLILFVCMFSLSNIVNAHLPFIYISGSSMFPTYEDGQKVSVNHDYDDIDRGDVAILSYKPGLFTGTLIKRVCGVPGDSIYMDSEGTYFVRTTENDIFYYEPKSSSHKSLEDLLTDSTLVVTLSDSELFVMGDNRDHSDDSRVLGTFSLTDVKALVVDGYVQPDTFIF